MPTKRVLVTGANGFVGRALCKELVRTRFDVVAAVRSTPRAQGLPCPFVAVGDIDPKTDWRVALAGVEAVVHLAARVHVMKAEIADPLAAYRCANVGGSVRLAQQAGDAGVRRLIFVSSVKVHGEMSGEHAFTEYDPPHPQDAYGISKLEAEYRLAEVCAASAMELTVLRPPLVYGAGVKGNLLTLMRAIDNGYPLPIGAVHNRRSLLGVDNLVAAIVLCLHHPRAAGSTFLLSDERPVSSADLARAISAALDRRARLWPVPVALLRLMGTMSGRSAAVARLTSSLLVDARAIRERLGWQPLRSFEDGVADMVREYRAERR